MTDKDKLSREDLRADRAAPPRRGTLHRILVLVAVLAVVLGAVLAAAYLDLSNFDSLRRALSYDKADAAGENTYDYDNDRTNRFALLGDRLLVVSTTRVSVLADDGSEVYAQEVKLDSPAIALGGRTAAVYDVGGTTLYILGERGLVRDLSTETENGIISAKLNSSDMLALVTDKSGYKSSVSVYNASGERVFTFNSSNRYMIDACVERGGKHVAVATLGSEDAMFVSTIRRYALDQETAVSACVLDDSLLYELSSFGGTLVAVTDDRFLALSGDGSLGGSYDYAYPYLRGSTLGGTDFGALVLSRYRSGSEKRRSSPCVSRRSSSISARKNARNSAACTMVLTSRYAARSAAETAESVTLFVTPSMASSETPKRLSVSSASPSRSLSSSGSSPPALRSPSSAASASDGMSRSNCSSTLSSTLG